MNASQLIILLSIFFFGLPSINLFSQSDLIERSEGSNMSIYESNKYKTWNKGLLIKIKNEDNTIDTVNLKDIITGVDKETAFKDQNNKTVNYLTFKNKVTLLDFWFLKCIPCIIDLPGLDLLKKKINSDDFELITFSNNSLEEMNAKLLRKKEFSFRVIPNVYLIGGAYPYKVLVNKKHEMIDNKVGGFRYQNAKAINLILDRYLPLIKHELKK